MDKSSKTYQFFMGFVILLATLFQGGFFSVEYIAVTIAFLVFIISSKEIYVSKVAFALTFGIVLLYYLSSMFSGYNTGAAFTESTKPLLLLLAVVAGNKVKKRSFLKSLVITSAVLGVIGLMSVCRLIELRDFVYIYDNVRTLQSTMQYANSTAILLICGIFAVRAIQRDGEKAFLPTMTEIILNVCLLFTHSRIAIILYIFLTLLEMLLLREGIGVKTVLNFASGAVIYYAMQFLISKRLSFVALVLGIVLVLLIAEKLSTVKRTAVKVNRITVISLLGIMFSAVLVFLYFADVSTFMIRILYYMDGIKALITRPVWGLSPGGWGEYQYNFQSAQYFVKQVHNGILQFGLDAGFPAMLLFIALLVLALLGLIKAWRKDKEINDLYVLLIFSALVLHGILDFDFSYGNILIILGVCISMGFSKIHCLKLKVPHKSLAVLCVAFLMCLGFSETLSFFAEAELSREDYQKAAKYYEIAAKTNPCDIESEVMAVVCVSKFDNTDDAENIIEKACRKRPDNQNLLLRAMDMAASDNDFLQYVTYQNQLLVCAPMQQSTYTNSIRYLDDFYRNNLIDETVYLKEKGKVITSATEANKKMSKFNQYLDFGTEIDINSLK